MTLSGRPARLDAQAVPDEIAERRHQTLDLADRFADFRIGNPRFDPPDEAPPLAAGHGGDLVEQAGGVDDGVTGRQFDAR
ncbi:MAG: hypothetical protein ACO3D0_12350 [Ilumatobacteraceae bacterium]